MNLLAYFLIYGFLGWLIDSIFRSITDKKLSIGNAFKPLPFAPIYGFGALLILVVDGTWTHVFSWPIQGLILGLILSAYELVSGHFCQYVFHRRLWRYNKSKNFLGGYTDIWHILMWGLLALAFLYWIHPWVEKLL